MNLPEQTGGTITIKPNAIGNYGNDWGTNEGSGDKVAAVQQSNSANIYTPGEDNWQSFEFENVSIPMGNAPHKLKLRINHQNAITNDLHLVVRVYMPSTGQYLENIYESDTTLKTELWEMILAPDGNPLTESFLNEMQIAIKSEGFVEPLPKTHELWICKWIEADVDYDVA